MGGAVGAGAVPEAEGVESTTGEGTTKGSKFFFVGILVDIIPGVAERAVTVSDDWCFGWSENAFGESRGGGEDKIVRVKVE